MENTTCKFVTDNGNGIRFKCVRNHTDHMHLMKRDFNEKVEYVYDATKIANVFATAVMLGLTVAFIASVFLAYIMIGMNNNA